MDRPGTQQRSWTAERDGWLARAGQVLGVDAERVGPQVVAAAVGRAGRLPVEPEPNPMRADTVISRLEERGATWNRRDVEREAAAVLREAGARVDDRSVTELVAAVVGHEDSVSLDAPDVGGPVPRALRRADGSSVFVRRGEQLFTSTAILAAERELAALAAVRSQSLTEAARRYRAGWAELDDDDLVRRVAGAGTRIAELDTQIRRAEADTPALERAAAEATAAAMRLRAEMPATSAVRGELAADDVAAARLAEIDRALAVRGLRRPRGRDRAALEGEARALRFERPMITLDVRTRAELAAEGLGRAEAVDARALAVADRAAKTATVAAREHRTRARVAGRRPRRAGRRPRRPRRRARRPPGRRGAGVDGRLPPRAGRRPGRGDRPPRGPVRTAHRPGRPGRVRQDHRARRPRPRPHRRRVAPSTCSRRRRWRPRRSATPSASPDGRSPPRCAPGTSDATCRNTGIWS